MLAFTQFGVDIAYSAIGHHYCGALVDGSTDIVIAGYKIKVPDGTSCSVYWLLIACDMAIPSRMGNSGPLQRGHAPSVPGG